jgi:hypothetical protein
MPGGGQIGLSAPPPPPPPDPEPIVVTASLTSIEVTAAGEPLPVATVDVALMGDHAVARFERRVDAAAGRSRPSAAAIMPATLRLVVMRYVVERSLKLLSTGIGLGG